MSATSRPSTRKTHQSRPAPIKSAGLFAPHAKRITVGVIVVCLLTVLGAMFGLWYFTPDKVAYREIEKIARDYYENYFYDSYFGTLTGDDRIAEFEKYITPGFAPTYLRQLLNYDNGKHQSSTPKFSDPSYFCDTNATKVIFYPYAPYGKTDYRMKIIMSCE